MSLVLRILSRIIAGLLWALCGAGGAQGAVLAIVASEQSPAYSAATDALIAQLGRHGLARSDVSFRLASETAQGEGGAKNAPKLLITLGALAFKQVLASNPSTPVIAALIPRLGFERLLRESGRKNASNVTALYLDQPFERQLNLVRLAFPDAARVGVLWGQESVLQRPVWITALRSSGLTEVGAQVDAASGSLYAGLKTTLEDADVLLAVPDPQVFNSTTIANILLATYRAHVPVLAFSPGYVKAGALLSLHSTPTQIGLEAAAIAHLVLHGGALAAPQYPLEFSVLVNAQVARSLGYTLDATVLTERLRKLENRP